MASIGSDFAVRAASVEDPADLAALAALRFRWRAEERGESGLDEGDFVAELAAWLGRHRDSHEGFLGFLGDEPVAIAWLAIVERVPGPGQFHRLCGYVQSVYVVPPWRNRGLGAALMAPLIDRARELSLDYLAVHPSSFAFPFYRRLGFAPTSGVLELDFRVTSDPETGR